MTSEEDLHLFHQGTHYQAHDALGSHLVAAADAPGGVAGTRFTVWAPNAVQVSVIGDWNAWKKGLDLMTPKGGGGLWEVFLPAVGHGMRYKYHVVSRYNGYRADKADPFARHTETPPLQASVVWDLAYEWGDGDWMARRAERFSESGAKTAKAAPLSAYEVHLGSWRRVPEEGNRSLTYREMAPLLAEHVEKLGFTHVEMMPVMEHPFFGSWGYQVTGYFAPSSRFGTPQDFMYLIDYLHQRGIGVILDWVPSHFPTDEHGLGYFDGTHLYEHADPRKGYHPDWKSFIFNYGRHEVQSFLASSALFWLDYYHADGLRVDAVASMLYLDYSRKAGEWIANPHGGRENLEAIAFLRAVNERVAEVHPDVQMIAEESTAWPMVSRPSYIGGLGFDFKWDMGWMHDTLEYLKFDPIHRKFHHGKLTFRTIYAFSENFVLPLSHDEVVHGKGSLLTKMAGDAWQKFANLRLLYGYMFAQPGKKLLFMGAELAQIREWNHDGSLDWDLLAEPRHAGIYRWLGDLNRLYAATPALHEYDTEPAGFEWIDCSDADKSILVMLRKGTAPTRPILIALNFTPVVRRGYQVGAPWGGTWKEILNSDALLYGGSGLGNLGLVEAEPVPLHGRSHSLTLTLPPLAAVFFEAPEPPKPPVLAEPEEGEAVEPEAPSEAAEEETAPEAAAAPVTDVPDSTPSPRAFAVAAHGDQVYGDRPYTFHLDAVAGLAAPYGEAAVAVAYLHDVVEDTAVSLEDIEIVFGARIAACVSLLTDEPGANRKERKVRTYARLAQVSGPNELALIVKTADRLANVRACVEDQKRSLWEVYRGEHPAFRDAAYRAGLCDPLWDELEELLAEEGFGSE